MCVCEWIFIHRLAMLSHQKAYSQHFRNLDKFHCYTHTYIIYMNRLCFFKKWNPKKTPMNDCLFFFFRLTVLLCKINIFHFPIVVYNMRIYICCYLIFDMGSQIYKEIGNDFWMLTIYVPLYYHKHKEFFFVLNYCNFYHCFDLTDLYLTF